MKRKWIIVSVLFGVLFLAVGVNVSQAQGPGSPEVQPVGLMAPEDLSIQGRLTDASGNPLEGNYEITASLYASSSGGAALCADTDVNVAVSNGLFNMSIGGCAGVLDGQQLYLGIKVGSDPEMTPRQIIYPVPYAWSLRPGAIINNTHDSGHGLDVESAANVASLVVGNSGTGPLIVGNSGTDPLIKGGDPVFFVENNGDVKQALAADGLVKAAVYAYCSTEVSGVAQVTRSFNNVTGGAVTIEGGAATGQCTLDFGFDISSRYWVAMAVLNAPRFVTCSLNGHNKLDCYRFTADGLGASGNIMVTLY
ncbi:MAG TPA: hypothetical protein VII97_06255 [Anaerolineales bacterium]